MTYFEAALQVLRSAKQPLTTAEITTRALERGLIAPRGKTPEATMAAELYRRLVIDPQLVKTPARGEKRAEAGTVRWALRSDPDGGI
jgi:hypothetical protein